VILRLKLEVFSKLRVLANKNVAFESSGLIEWDRVVATGVVFIRNLLFVGSREGDIFALPLFVVPPSSP